MMVYVNSFAIALLVCSPLFFIILMRFGLLAEVAGFLVFLSFIAFPTTLDASAWYSKYGFVSVAMIAVIVLYAFRISLGGHPLLAPSRLDD